MELLEKVKDEYIKIVDFLFYSEELLGVSTEKAREKVVEFLKRKEISIYFEFKGYCLITSCEPSPNYVHNSTKYKTPYQSFEQCNYIHAWIECSVHKGILAKRIIESNYRDFSPRIICIDKLITSQYINMKYTPSELDPIPPIILDKDYGFEISNKKPFISENSMKLDEDFTINQKDLYFKKSEILKILSLQEIELSRDEQISKLATENRRLRKSLSNSEEMRDELKVQLQALVSQSDTPAQSEPIFDELDPRTQNNFIRLLLAVNEMAKDKQGNYIDLDKEYNKDHTDLVNIKLDLLSYKPIKETAYKTLISLIKERRARGLQ